MCKNCRRYVITPLLIFSKGSVQAKYAAEFTVEDSPDDSFIQQAAKKNLQAAISSGTFDSTLNVDSDSLQPITLTEEEEDTEVESNRQRDIFDDDSDVSSQNNTNGKKDGKDKDDEEDEGSMLSQDEESVSEAESVPRVIQRNLGSYTIGEQFLFVVEKDKVILQVDVTSGSAVRLPLGDEEHPTRVTYDPFTDYVYWSDSRDNVIKRARRNGRRREIIINRVYGEL
ncbi:Hypp9420 [Branchiostoma lanceolatum]|uniref:Hypp9420 protein n=1 Tax=Branchiostoma lanceolatum TaxID=7740 RepID=A0A8S4MLU8_BRALA|nr:Hypp9420 [Branchiostoma lanceolatum]